MSGIVPIIHAEYLLANNPPILRLIDVTNYNGAGASHNDTIYGLFSINDPSGGLLYQNSEYVAAAAISPVAPNEGDLVPYRTSAPITQIDIELPIDFATNGAQQGLYVVNYLIYVHQASGTTLNGYYPLQVSYNLCPQIPIVNLDIEVDCICGKYISVDKTDYGSYASISYSHTVNYPGGVQLDPVVSGLDSIVVPLYTPGTYTTIVNAAVTFTAGMSSVTYLVQGSKETAISCEKSTCDVACQYFKLQDQYEQDLKTNPTVAAQTFQKLTIISSLLNAISMAMNCGETQKINGYLDQIYAVGNFTPGGCNCSDDKPQLVSGCGNVITGNTYTATANNGINVFTVTTGGSSEFQFQLEPTLYNILTGGGGITRTAFTAGANMTITPVTSTDGSLITYTFDANVSGATITIAQVTGLQAALDAKQTTTLTSAHILVGNGSNVATSVAMSGDTTIDNTGAVTVAKINGVGLGSTTATSGNILIGSGSAWVTHAISGDATISNTGVLTLASSGVSASTYTSVTVDAKGRVTGGTNPGFITANQTITLTGDVTGTGTTGITTTIANGAVVAAYMATDSVATASIQNGAVTSTKYANTSIPTSAYQTASVTGGATGVIALNTITMDNMATDLKKGFFNVEVSFASDGSGAITMPFPFSGAVTIADIKGVVTETVGGGDVGSITFGSSTGSMGSSISVPASSAVGYVPSDYVPVGNNVITTGTVLTITTAKTTPGGKVLLTIAYTRA